MQHRSGIFLKLPLTDKGKGLPALKEAKQSIVVHSAIPTLRRQRQEDQCQFEHPDLPITASSRAAMVQSEILSKRRKRKSKAMLQHSKEPSRMRVLKNTQDSLKISGLSSKSFQEGLLAIKYNMGGGLLGG